MYMDKAFAAVLTMLMVGDYILLMTAIFSYKENKKRQSLALSFYISITSFLVICILEKT